MRAIGLKLGFVSLASLLFKLLMSFLLFDVLIVVLVDVVMLVSSFDLVFVWLRFLVCD